MRDLFLMRHAKSSWNLKYLDDFDRPLNKRGRKAAELMAKWLSDEGISPDLTICSTACRTTETVNIMSESGFLTRDLQFIQSLYHADLKTLFSLARGVDAEVRSLLVIGHNPSMFQFFYNLLLRGDSFILSKFPTAAFAHFSVPIDDWGKLEPKSATLTGFMTPKQLQSLVTD